MRFLRLLTKNTALSKVYSKVESGTVNNSYLFSCEDKALLDEAVALFIAKYVALTKADDLEKIADRVLRNGYADVKNYPSGETVKTEDVNAILSDVYVTPYELNKKFYVIDNAETANESAQNKLLKTLEDTPSTTCIIMKATSTVPILPTIKSRCAKVEITPFNKEDVQEALAQYSKSDKFEFAVGISGGFPGIAIEAMNDENEYKMFSVARDTLLYMKSSKDLLHYSNRWLAYKQNVDKILSYVELLLSDFVIFDSKSGSSVRLFGEVKTYSTMQTNGYNSRSAIKILPKIWEAKQKLDFYASATGVVDSVLYTILEVKTKCQK